MRSHKIVVKAPLWNGCPKVGLGLPLAPSTLRLALSGADLRTQKYPPINVDCRNL